MALNLFCLVLGECMDFRRMDLGCIFPFSIMNLELRGQLVCDDHSPSF